jgi:hypothetical protein
MFVSRIAYFSPFFKKKKRFAAHGPKHGIFAEMKMRRRRDNSGTIPSLLDMRSL